MELSILYCYYRVLLIERGVMICFWIELLLILLFYVEQEMIDSKQIVVLELLTLYLNYRTLIDRFESVRIPVSVITKN